jgi:hypothetical protein
LLSQFRIFHLGLDGSFDHLGFFLLLIFLLIENGTEIDVWPFGTGVELGFFLFGGHCFLWKTLMEAVCRREEKKYRTAVTTIVDLTLWGPRVTPLAMLFEIEQWIRCERET